LSQLLFEHIPDEDCDVLDMVSLETIFRAASPPPCHSHAPPGRCLRRASRWVVLSTWSCPTWPCRPWPSDRALRWTGRAMKTTSRWSSWWEARLAGREGDMTSTRPKASHRNRMKSSRCHVC